MLIFDEDDFQVIFRPGNSKFALVTFSSLGMFTKHGSLANGRVFWGQQLADAGDIETFGFVAKSRNWFCSTEMHAAIPAVLHRVSAGKRLVVYGSSMGGYAALRWAKLLRAAATISFSPQVSIDPTVVGTFDKRYEYAFERSRHEGMTLNPAHTWPNAYLFYDPYDTADSQHATLIRAANPDCNLVPMYLCGHECIRALASTNTILAIFGFCLDGDIAGLRALANKARRLSDIRAFTIISRLVNEHRTLAQALFDARGKRFEIAQQAIIREKLLY